MLCVPNRPFLLASGYGRMIALLQRVSRAAVAVDGKTLAQIGPGLLVFVGVQRGDAAPEAARLAERLTAYRVFADAEGRMNLDVRRIDGEILLVPQFTLAADTAKGNRPGFSRAAEPADARALFTAFVTECRRRHSPVAVGEFGADMQVSLINDGPVTFWLEVRPS